MVRFHTQTAGSSLTAQQPHNNIIRTTMQALAAVLGGTQSLHTNGFDEALGLPTEESARLALRTQQIIAEESGIVASADPLGGSYLIESLTDHIETEARLRIEKIDAMGGMLSAIESHYPQSEIENSAYDAQRAIETKEQRVVGVNVYTEDSRSEPPVMTISGAVEQEQRARVSAFRQGRVQERVDATLAGLKVGAQGRDNLVALIVESVRASATLGEISDTLREVFGEYDGV
jgi:methylmalonyl-CoA mutase N-terminal domain/subunit